MRARLLIPMTALVGAAFFSVPQAHAVPIVYDFSTPLGNQGNTHAYSPNANTAGYSQTVLASGFGPGTNNAVNLFGKNLGADEAGLGLTNDASGDNEITTGSFIQLTLANLKSPPLDNVRLSFWANSVQAGESWQVFGSNTAGTLTGATLIASGTTGNLVADLGANILGTYAFLDVTTPTALPGNILLREIDNSITVAAPEPASLALLGTALLGLGALRRRRRR